MQAVKKLGPQRLGHRYPDPNDPQRSGLEDGPDTAGDHGQGHDRGDLLEAAPDLGDQDDRQHERAGHQEDVLDGEEGEDTGGRGVVDAVDEVGWSAGPC